jgi:hypothetical protein
LIRINISAYFLLSTVCGFFLGGTFNMLVGNEVIRIVGNKKENVNYLSTLSMMANNMITAVVELLIGYLLNNSTKGHQKELFQLLIAVAIVSSIILFVRIKYYQ